MLLKFSMQIELFGLIGGVVAEQPRTSFSPPPSTKMFSRVLTLLELLRLADGDPFSVLKLPVMVVG